jgi:putative transposase
LYYTPAQSYEETVMMNMIDELHYQFPYYGYRKIQAALYHRGVVINHKRVQRLMRLLGIQTLYAGPDTSMPNKSHRHYPYLLRNLLIDHPNQVWAVDITYIRLSVGMVYLFALIDWFSRFIVGCKLAHTMEEEHALEAFRQGLQHGAPDICNADQGSQFTGTAWQDELTANSVRISHDGKGRYQDNIRIERFWRSVKYEDFFLKCYESLIDARLGVAQYMQHYNYSRPHQALDYKRPADLFFN